MSSSKRNKSRSSKKVSWMSSLKFFNRDWKIALVKWGISLLVLLWATYNIGCFMRFSKHVPKKDIPYFTPIYRGMPVDIAITWFNYSDQKNLKPIQPRHHDTYYEIKYTLRSFEKYGLLDQVRNVFIVYNSDFNDPPEFMKSDYDGKIKLMPHR